MFVTLLSFKVSHW